MNFPKKLTLFFSILCLAMIPLGCVPPEPENKPVSTSDNLHTRYSPLLQRAINLRYRGLRCDFQVLPWILNALDAIENDATFTAKGGDFGMSFYKEAPKTPVALVQEFLKPEVLCSIPDYLKRATDDLRSGGPYTFFVKENEFPDKRDNLTAAERREIEDVLTKLALMETELSRRFNNQ